MSRPALITCAACGEPITDNQNYRYKGLYYHMDHLPTYPPGPEQVLRALRLIESRAKGNAREEITLGDIEWAIQEMQKP
jgi:hypothetical protein